MMLTVSSKTIQALRRQGPSHTLRRSLAVRVFSTAEQIKIKVLGINGSLRKDSTHKGMLHAAARRLPPNTSFEIADIASLPLYNDDLWQGLDDDSALPAPIRRFRQQVSESDVILFSSPEYNGSLTGPLKNALDWGSKHPCAFAFKVACVMGAGGSSGTARAQAHLRSVTSLMNMTWAPYIPGVGGDLMVNRFAPGFTGFEVVTGEVVDKGLEERIAALVAHNVAWARKVKPLMSGK